ncbi:hypothetical protein GGX14DRAFT_602214 [Mycena pura]|uniref:Uncharacterized protein n=1 Tax=Mycena pura TaxID=153505 RepID=A0AAD6VUW3_9AGAR|nr:hypothetical protein GGX14DRAFT_602214 [Mycena pura]
MAHRSRQSRRDRDCIKFTDYDDVGDAEMEEREFLLLFPSFEDALGPDSQIQASTKGGQGVGHIPSSHSSSSSDVWDGFSLPLRFALLRSRLSSTQIQLVNDNGTSNFCSDANIAEAKKATTVANALKTRLQILVKEWPDQMVLHQLVGRCDAVLMISAARLQKSYSFPSWSNFLWASFTVEHNCFVALRYTAVIWLGKLGHSQDTLDRVSRISWATHRYYSLFSSHLSATLLEKRTALENKPERYHYPGIEGQRARTHHQLYKVMRRMPVIDHMRPQYAGESESLQIRQSIDTWNSIMIPSFPDTELDVPPAHLYNLAPTFKKFGDFLHTHIWPLTSSRSALVVDNLAVDIIVTKKELAAVTIQSTLKQQKAWSDLLKELKRAGFTAIPEPEILQQQSDARWLRRLGYEGARDGRPGGRLLLSTLFPA